MNLFVWTSSVLASWEVVHPTIPKNLIYDACWGDGRFVAVGELGAIKTSPDGLNWTLQKTITGSNLRSVAFTGTKFVAAGDHGTIIWSANGIDWSFTSASTIVDFTRVRVLNGALFALGSSGNYGVIYRSTDGGNQWERVAAEADGLFGMCDLVYFGGEYIAMSSFSSNKAWRSTDLNIWTEHTNWNPKISVTWADVIDGKLVVANVGVSHSIDGINWTASSTALGIGRVVAFGGAYYGIKQGPYSGVYRSTDLVSWISLNAIGEEVLCSGGGRILAMGQNAGGGDVPNVSTDGEAWERYENWTRCAAIFDGGVFRSAVGNFLYSSIDGQAWTSTRLPQGFNADSIYFSNGKYFVSGGSKLIVSTDAANWTAGSYRVDHAPVFAFGKWFAGGRQSPDGLTWSALPGTAVNGREIAAGNGLLVSVRGWSNLLEWWTSSNGTTWTRRTIAESGGDSIAFGNGVFVCVGRYTETIRTSTNGVSWTTRALPPDSQWYEKVRFVNGRFVASGDGGTIGWSLDGITWHAANYPVWGVMTPPAYGNSTWLTTGESVSLKSTDLKNWTQLTDYSAIRFKKVRYLNGEFWAVDKTDDNIVTGSLWRSADGRVWKPVHRFYFEPTDIAFGNGTYVVTSDYQKASFSTNEGATWTDVTAGSSRLSAIIFGMGRFTIVGQGMIFHSPDGINWSSLSIVAGPDFKQIADTSLGLFAVGRKSSQGSIVYRSTDGTTWSPVYPGGVSLPQEFQTITEIGSVVYVGGENGSLIKTTDGLAWTTVLPAGTSYLSDFQSTALTEEGFVKLDANGELSYTWDLVGFTDFRVIPLGVSWLASIALGDGVLIGVGERGTIVRCVGEPYFAPPQSLSFVEAGDRFLDFSWVAAPGAQPQGIEVRYRAVGEQAWIQAPSILGGPGLPLRLAGLEPGTTYELSVRAIYPGGASGYFDVPTAAPETLTPIEYWRIQKFGITSGTSDAADGADPDFDGKSNLLEYALGCDPTVPDGFDAVQTRWDHSGAMASVFLTFPCDAFRSDIDWEVWISNDGMSSWARVARCAKGARCVSSGAWSVDDPYEENSSGTGYQRRVMVEVRSDHRAAFFRLKVVRNP